MALQLSLITFVITVILFYVWADWYFKKHQKEQHLSAATYYSSFWSIAAGVLMVLAILFYKPSEPLHQIQAVIASLAGAGVGWLLGMYISPMGTSEMTAFQRYGTALAGIFSGYTLKSFIEFARNNRARMESHWFPIALFCIAVFVSMAVVYSSRAYDQKALEVHIKGDKPELSEDGAIKVTKDKTVFYAAVTGPGDPAVAWMIRLRDQTQLNAPLDHEISQCGVLTFRGRAKARCRLIATNLEDPSLSNFVNIDIDPPTLLLPSPSLNTTTTP